ncbi:MAG TPA: hypothetical protein EYP85_05825, partial [Armatimonadetes bacterium]|nr:hypothetical protein [Armatimonadota bacterium]
MDAPPGGLASIITTLRARLVRATAQSLAPATLGQGQKRVRMLRLVLTAAPNSQGASVLTQVRVHKIGTSTDAHSTTDISRVQIFHDLNGNDLVDSADEELTDPLLTHIFPLGGTYLDVPLARPLIIQPGTSERLLFTYDVHPVSNTEVSIGAAFKQPARLEGTASAVAGNQLTDAQANYAPDSLGGRVLKIISGAEAGREFRITGNTATTITVAEDFSGTASGDRYLVSSDFFFSPTGVATDVTAEVVTDAAATYFPNELQGRTLLWLTGVEAGVRYSVQGNTATTITAAQPFNGARAGDRYVILNTLDRLTAIPEPVTGPVLASAETSIVDTVTVTGEDLAPLSVAQGDRAVIMQKLTFTVSPNPAGTAGARVTSLLVNKTGPATGRAEDVAFVHLYEEVNDANNNLRIDAGEGRLLATVSVVENAARFENLQLTVTQGKPQEIWLAVDVSPTATTDTALGLALSRPDEVGIASPDRVAEDNFPFATKQSRIGDALTIVGTSLAPVSAEPGQEGVPVQQLIFTTKTNEVTLIGLRVTLALRGNVSARARPSDFISFLSAVHDVNGNGTIDPADEVLGSGTYSGDFRVEEGERTATADITVAEGKFVITTDRAKYLLLVANVASVAQRGVEVSFRLDGVNPAHPNELAADNAVAVVFPDSVYPGTFPLSTEPMIIGNLLTIQGEAAAPPRIFRTQEQVVLQHLQLRASPEDVTLERITFRRLGTAPDVTFSALRLVHDDDGDGLFNPVRDQTQWGADETFAGGRVVFTPRVVVPKGRWTTIFLLADVVEGAPVGETIGAELAAATDVEVDQQSAVARTGFPISSGLATIGDGLAVEGVPVVQEPPIIAGQVGQGRENLALLALKLTPLTGSVTLTQLRVDNVEENDEDFAAVKLFVDTNGDGRFFLDPTDPRNSDTQIGTARRFGEAGFPGTVTFPNLNLTLQEPTLLFVAVDVSPNARISTPQNPNRLVIEVKDVTFSSTATGISGTVLTDTKAAFVPDQLVGQRLWFRTGAEAGVERTIVRNSRQTINVDRPFSGAQPGDAYTVTVPPSVGVQAPDVVAPFPDVDGDGNPDSIRSDRDVAAPEVQANKLSVTLTNLAPAQGEQGQPGVLMAQLRLSTTAGTLLLRSLQVALSGGGSTPEPGDDADVNDVERVRLFHDVDGDGTIDAGVDVEAAPVQTFTRQVGIPFAGIATFPSLNQTITP